MVVRRRGDRIGIALKLEMVVLTIIIGKGKVFMTRRSLDRCAARPSAHEFRTHKTRRTGVERLLNVLCLCNLLQERMKTGNILSKTSKHQK